MKIERKIILFRFAFVVSAGKITNFNNGGCTGKNLRNSKYFERYSCPVWEFVFQNLPGSALNVNFPGRYKKISVMQ